MASTGTPTPGSMSKGHPFLVLTGTQTIFGDRDREATDAFARHRGILCEDAIEPSLLERLMGLCDRAAWDSDPHPIGDRLTENPPLASRAIRHLLTRPELLRWLETVTGCGPIAAVNGCVVRTDPLPHDRLIWHNDLNQPNRRLAITINLGAQPYEGAEFELRDVETREILLRHLHRVPGQMLIFEVARRSEHRVRRMLSGGPRRVFAGWFMAKTEGEPIS